MKNLVLLTAFLMHQAGSPFSGNGVQGGGHVCDSGLRIYSNKIDWDTTYSNCLNTPYDTIQKTSEEFVYRLKPKSKSCKFRVLIVRKNSTMNAWDAIGYSTETAWHHSDDAKRLVCGPLY